MLGYYLDYHYRRLSLYRVCILTEVEGEGEDYFEVEV